MVKMLIVDSKVRMEDLTAALEKQLWAMKPTHSLPSSKAMAKHLALIHLKSGNEREGISRLVESHGAYTRLIASNRSKRALRTKQKIKHAPLDKQYTNFAGSASEAYDRLMITVKQLPKEWSVIQITCMYNPRERLQDPKGDRQIAGLHITRFACGETFSQPYCITIPFPKHPAWQILTFFSDTLQKNRTCLTDSAPEQRQKYWRNREDSELRIKEVIQIVDQLWLGKWRCLLPGQLASDSARKKIQLAIDGIFTSGRYPFQMTLRKWNIIRQIVENITLLTFPELTSALGEVFDCPETDTMLQQLAAELVKLDVCSDCPRNPVILILDDIIDSVPWESTETLKNQLVTRSISLHLLLALYKANECRMKAGHVCLNPDKGQMIVAGADLVGMQKRWSAFMSLRMPSWPLLMDNNPSRASFEEALSAWDVLIYAGHGSASKYCPGSSVRKLHVSAAALLFGCSSSRMLAETTRSQTYGQCINYLLGASPCVVGNLWEVTDVDADRVAMALLDKWLPPPKPELYQQLKRAEAINQARVILKSPTHTPQLLSAVVECRNAARHVMTGAALILRGLPVQFDMSASAVLLP